MIVYIVTVTLADGRSIINGVYASFEVATAKAAELRKAFPASAEVNVTETEVIQ